MADFVDIPINVTAEQIEKKVKETIDDTVRRGSINPVMSGAVANAFELFKADTDHIKDGAVTSKKLANGSVNSEKLAGASVDYYHLKYGAVHPEALDRAYARLNTINTVLDDSSFHNLLIQNADELSDPFKKVVLFLVQSISEGMTANIKKGRCFGFFVSKQEFWFTNINYNITYRVMFDDLSLVSVESININLAVLEPENGGDDGGEQFKEYIDDNYIGYFPTGGASNPYVFYNFYTPYPYKNEQLKIVLNSSNSLISFYTRECHLDTDGQIEWTDWQDLMARTNVDQTYNPESENAQSGKAVAEAIKNIETIVDLGTMSVQEVYEYDFKEGVFYTYVNSNFAPMQKGPILAHCYSRTVNDENILYLFARDYTGVFYVFDLKNKTYVDVIQEHFAPRLTDWELNIDSFNPIANNVVTAAINDINASLGDIDTALDNIIAIQEGYIGGASE